MLDSRLGITLDAYYDMGRELFTTFTGTSFYPTTVGTQATPENFAEIVTDSEAMSKLFAEEAAVMIEKKGVSLYQRVYDMVDLCVENEVSILGVIDTRK